MAKNKDNDVVVMEQIDSICMNDHLERVGFPKFVTKNGKKYCLTDKYNFIARSVYKGTTISDPDPNLSWDDALDKALTEVD